MRDVMEVSCKGIFKKMRVGIDVRVLGRNRAGFERYLYHLLENLARIDERNEYVLYSDHSIDKQYIHLKGNFIVKVIACASS